MKKLIGFTMVCMVMLACAHAAEFVNVEKLDEVFLNVDEDGEAGWGDLSLGPKLIKMAKGSVKASGEGAASHEGPEKAFDGNAESKYCTLSHTMWLQYQFADGGKRIEAYSITTANDSPGRDPGDWTLQGSNDGKEWSVLDKRSGETFSKRFQRREFKVANPGDYACYKLDVTKNSGDQSSQIAELELLTAKDKAERDAAGKKKRR